MDAVQSKSILMTCKWFWTRPSEQILVQQFGGGGIPYGQRQQKRAWSAACRQVDNLDTYETQRKKKKKLFMSSDPLCSIKLGWTVL